MTNKKSSGKDDMELEHKDMPNHVQEFFSQTEREVGSELFRINDSNSDLKSELSEEEIRLIDVLKSNDDHLEELGIGAVFTIYYKNFLRLKVSLQRKGRGEYVDVHKKDNSDTTISRFSNLKTILSK